MSRLSKAQESDDKDNSGKKAVRQIMYYHVCKVPDHRLLLDDAIEIPSNHTGDEVQVTGLGPIAKLAHLAAPLEIIRFHDSLAISCQWGFGNLLFTYDVNDSLGRMFGVRMAWVLSS